MDSKKKCRSARELAWPTKAMLALLVGVLVFSKGAIGAQPVGTLQESSSLLTNRSILAATDIAFPKVFGASRWEQPITQAPSSVSIFTADEIKKYGYRTLADILQSASGFHVSYDRNYSLVGVRGFSRGDFSNRVLIMVDGHRLNNGLSDGAPIGTEFPLDVDLIDRVEVIRGPGSVLYGNNAVFGVINVVTRLGGDLSGHGAEVSGEAAGDDTWKGRVTYGRLFKNGVEMHFSGSLYDSSGPQRLFFKDFKEQDGGIARGLDDDAFRSFFGTLAFRDFSLQGAFIEREKGNPTAKFPPTLFNDPRLRTTDERGYVNLKFTHEFPEVVDVAANLYYDRNDLDIRYPLQDDPDLDQESQVAEWWGMELQLTRSFFDRHTITLGAEYRDVFRQEFGYFTNANYAASTTLQEGLQNHGVFLQGDVTVFTNLHVNAGARYDKYGDFDPEVNPRVALIYNPFENSTVKAIYGTAFRAPNFFEFLLYLQKELHPESVTTYELIFEQAVGQNIRASVTGFYSQIEDLIIFAPLVNLPGLVNVGDAEATGLELGLEGLWSSGLRGRISYTLQETREGLTGRILTDSPKHLGKFNLSAPFYRDKAFAGLEFQYTSMRTTWRGSEVSGFGVVNFTLFSQNLVRGMDLSASVYNVLDREYADPATPFHLQSAIPREGRSFRVKLTYRY